MQKYNLTNTELSHDFVAIDIEYADSAQNICQVGLVIVRDLKIVDYQSWLIQPPGNYYEHRLMAVHNITPDVTVYSPYFVQAWPEIWEFLEGEQLWAHNATSVEEPVINKNLRFAGLDGEVRVQDSRDLYQRPGFPANSGNGLVQCCMALGIPVRNHHDALADAEMCAEIVIAYIQGQQPCWENVPLAVSNLHKQEQNKRILRLGDFTGYYESTTSGMEDVFAVLTSTYEDAPEQKVDVFDKGDTMPKEKYGTVDFARLQMGEDNPLRGKKVVLTGAFAINRKEIERAIAAMGGKKVSQPTKNADVIIIGPVNVSSAKLIALEAQEAKGHHLARIVGDVDLEELFYGDGRKFFKY